jgi:selenocysteine lyase/cysteine desulfurase
MTGFATLRRRFPVLCERRYFATHNFGPVLVDALADLDVYRRTLALRNRAVEHWLAMIGEVRGAIAQLVNASSEDIALGPNATACQASIAAALTPVGARNVILTTDLDFPSSRYLWHAQARRGFEIRGVPSDGIAMPTEQLVAAIDERVAVVAVPHVAYRNGALLDARRVIDAAHRAGAIVVLDAYQAAGIVPIDVRALDVDVLVAGTNKWLGAPATGCAFAYVKRELADRLEPAFPGWLGHADVFGFCDEFVPAPGARRFEQGAPAVEPIYGARAGIRFALDVGVARMRERSLDLCERFIAAADELGIPLATPRARDQRAGFVCLRVPDPARAVAELRDLGIDADTRPGTGVRFSVHPCLDEEDVAVAVAYLKSSPRAPS